MPSEGSCLCSGTGTNASRCTREEHDECASFIPAICSLSRICEHRFGRNAEHGITASLVHMREVFKAAFLSNSILKLKQDHEAWVRASLPERGRSSVGWTGLFVQGEHPVDFGTAEAALSQVGIGSPRNSGRAPRCTSEYMRGWLRCSGLSL